MDGPECASMDAHEGTNAPSKENGKPSLVFDVRSCFHSLAFALPIVCIRDERFVVHLFMQFFKLRIL